MSNALYAIAATATQPAGAPAETQASSFLITVLGAGVCVLVVIVLRWIIHPGRLGLKDTPGRSNQLHPAHVVAMLALGFCLTALSSQLKDERWRLLGWGGAEVVWLAACLAVASTTFRFGLRAGLGFSGRHWVLDGGRGVVACLAVLPACMALLLLYLFLIRLLPPEQASRWLVEHELFRSLGQLSPAWHALPVFVAVVLAPLAEEVFFRGMLQSMLRRYLGSWPAVIATALLFGLVHIGVPQSVVPLVVLGAVLGYAYERTGRLLAPIVTHAMFNAVFFAEELIHRFA